MELESLNIVPIQPEIFEHKGPEKNGKDIWRRRGDMADFMDKMKVKDNNKMNNCNNL